MLLATAPLLVGGVSLIPMLISMSFILMGTIGIIKERTCLLTAHFVYSMILYVLSLTVVVLMVLYCDSGCDWWMYVFGFLVILFQAIGMRHCRIVLLLLKKKQGFKSCCGKRFNYQASCQKKLDYELYAFKQEIARQEREKVEVAPQNVPSMMYTIPPQQFTTMNMQPNIPFPQYYAMPLQYPYMMVPPPVSAPVNNENTNTNNSSMNGVNPIVFKQI